MKKWNILSFFIQLLLGLSLNAQKVDLSLRFNPNSSEYNVFAKSDFTKEAFLISEVSQITILIPSEFQDMPLKTTTLLDGEWIDQTQVFAPTNYSEMDFHIFVSEGGVINFQQGQEVQLFSFALPLNYDHKKVRLFVNDLDENIAVKNGSKNLANFIANEITLTDFYQHNYDISKNIQGTIKDWRGSPMENIIVKVGNQSFTSLYDGRFEFNDVWIEDAVKFSFYKEIPANTGVNTADLIRLQQHLLGEKLLDQPFQWIAADLDNSGTITYRDAELLKQIINEEFLQAGWRILPTNWLFSPTKYQQSIPRKLTIKSAERVFDAHFTAIKLGDIDGSYTLKEDIPNNIYPSPKTLTINLLNKELKAGESYKIPFSTNDFAGLTAYQATLKIENAHIIHVENTFKNHPRLSLNQSSEDVIIINWLNDKVGRIIPINQVINGSNHQSETSILQLEIIPKKDGLLSDFITILHQPKRTEAYDRDGKVMTVQLLFRKALEEAQEFVLYQNQPNPFKELTNISYFLSNDGPIVLKLIDESGKVLKVFNENGQKGFNAFTLDGNEIPKGLIYYQLETKFGKFTKKMLHLN